MEFASSFHQVHMAERARADPPIALPPSPVMVVNAIFIFLLLFEQDFPPKENDPLPQKQGYCLLLMIQKSLLERGPMSFAHCRIFFFFSPQSTEQTL